MNLTKTLGVLLAVVLVASAGVAALPGNAPADTATQAGNQSDAMDDRADAHDEADGDEADGDADENDSDARPEHVPDHAGNADERRGPPVDMPDPVPDFVSQVHELVNQKLDGEIGNLGERISDLLGDENAGDQQASDEQTDTDDDATDTDDATEDSQSADETRDGSASSTATRAP